MRFIRIMRLFSDYYFSSLFHYLVYEGEDYSYAYEDVEDGEEFAYGCCWG